VAEKVFEITGVHYSYPNGTHALRGVDLQVRTGEFVGLIGQNGSGKTTLAKHLNGLLRPSQGRISFKGADSRKLKASELSSRVGYVFQNPDYQIFLDSVWSSWTWRARRSSTRRP
jgi:energy-coupling factor transporter ATP-binding protein EcfA2